jgi:hypothetical protein
MPLLTFIPDPEKESLIRFLPKKSPRRLPAGEEK